MSTSTIPARWPLLLLLVLLVSGTLAPGLLGAPLAQAFNDGQAASLVLGQHTLTENMPGLDARHFYHPYDVAVDPTTGAVFVADANNNRVLRFASRASLSNGVPAVGVLGQPDFLTAVNRTSSEGMFAPFGVTVDGSGRLWVADYGNNRVLWFDAAASKTDGAAADGVLGQPDFTSFAAATTAHGMRGPAGVTIDENGRLWVADRNNNRVLRFDNVASTLSGAPADGVLGQLDFTSGNPATAAQRMDQPRSVDVDTAGTLWVSDTANQRVLRFDMAASKPNGAAANGVLGQPNLTSNSYATTAQRFFNPAGVQVDGHGALWVADTYNHRVLRFDAAAHLPNGAPAAGVLGQPDFTSAIPATTAQGVHWPYGVTVDDSGRLWVADTYNHRVLLFETTPALTNTPTMSPTASSTPTPTPNELLTPFGLVCRTAPGVVTAGGTISLPAGQQAILQSSWTTLHPLDLRTTPAFLPEQSMQDGDSFRISVPWPGVRTNDRLVQVTISLTLLDPTTRRPLPDQSRLLDYYWYPQACDPSTATPTSAPTATPLLTLLQNGGFEPGTLIGWEPTGAVQVRADAAWRGQYGAHLLTGGRLDQVFATTPGQRYYVSARLRLTSEPVAPTWGGMRLQVVNSTWQQLAASPGQSASTQPLGQWYRVDLVFDADQPQSRLIVQNFSNGQIAADLDEVIVSTSPIPPDAALPVPTLATSPTPTATAVAAPPPGALCRLDPGWLTLTSTVALPSGQPALLQTNWRITVPSDRTTEPVYQLHGPVQDGDTITTSVLWPGIRSSDTAVQVVLGTILLDPLTMNPLPGTSTSQSFYWYPWVCPAPTP